MKIVADFDLKQFPHLYQAVDLANQMLDPTTKFGKNFFEEVRKIEKFDNSFNPSGLPLSGKDIEILITSDSDKVTEVTLKLWKFLLWPFTAALASTKGSAVRLNPLRLDRSIESFVNTLVHESMHVLDNKLDEYEFGHGDNYAKGKDNTVPYKLGSIAEELAGKILSPAIA